MKSEKKAKQKLVRFKAKAGSRITDEEASIYGQHIIGRLKKSTSSITAKEVLEDAKNKNAPYHDHFNWDDTSAAEEFRTAQARQLISSIVEIKIIKGNEVPVRVFVNVINEEGERSYVPSEYAMVRPKLAEQIIAQALREVKNWSNKYEEYRELAKIRRAVIDTEQEFIIEED